MAYQKIRRLPAPCSKKPIHYVKLVRKPHSIPERPVRVPIGKNVAKIIRGDKQQEKEDKKEHKQKKIVDDAIVDCKKKPVIIKKKHDDWHKKKCIVPKKNNEYDWNKDVDHQRKKKKICPKQKSHSKSHSSSFSEDEIENPVEENYWADSETATLSSEQNSSQSSSSSSSSDSDELYESTRESSSHSTDKDNQKKKKKEQLDNDRVSNNSSYQQKNDCSNHSWSQDWKCPNKPKKCKPTFQKAFETALSPDQETAAPLCPRVKTSGCFRLKFDKALSEAKFELDVFRGRGITQAHLHFGKAGTDGPIVAFLFNIAPLEGPGVCVDGLLAKGTLKNEDIIPNNGVNNIASLLDAIRNGNIYVNVHSVKFPAGVVRGQIFSGDDSVKVN